MTAKKPTDQYSEKEAAERRDAVIKRMIAMPPKPHSEMKLGKPRGKPSGGTAKRKQKSSKQS